MNKHFFKAQGVNGKEVESQTLVFDTVPYMAIKLGRRGMGIELNPEYWRNGVKYCRDAESATTQESLFDLSELGDGNEKQN